MLLFIHSNSESFRSQLSPSVRKCYFPDERVLTQFNEYRQINCLYECKISKVIETCGCSPIQYAPPVDYMHSSHQKICDVFGNLCFEEALENLTESLDPIGSHPCGCLPDCDYTEYKWKMAFEPKELNISNLREHQHIFQYLRDAENQFQDQFSNVLFSKLEDISFRQKIKKNFNKDIGIVHIYFR